jgi:hypothetical protein
MATLEMASAQLSSRPPDESFPSVEALVENAALDKHFKQEIIKTFDLPSDHAQGIRLKANPNAYGDLEKYLSTKIRLEDKVRVVNGDGIELQPTQWALQQLLRLTTPASPYAYLDTLPVETVCQAVNHSIKHSPSRDIHMLLRKPTGPTSRTPTLRAVVSGRYSRVWDSDLYAQVQDVLKQDEGWVLPPTWEGPPSGAYRGDRDSFLILTNGGSIVQDPTLMREADEGQMFRGLIVRNSEVGNASLSFEAVLFRYICGNHMLWGATIDESLSFGKRHVGNLQDGDWRQALQAIGRAWTDRPAQQDTDLIRALATAVVPGKDTAAKIATAVGITDLSKKQITQAVQVATDEEAQVSPVSYWGLAQGITRLSQVVYPNRASERRQMDVSAGLLLKAGRANVELPSHHAMA